MRHCNRIQFVVTTIFPNSLHRKRVQDNDDCSELNSAQDQKKTIDREIDGFVSGELA
jgi:hypothetical protein